MFARSNGQINIMEYSPRPAGVLKTDMLKSNTNAHRARDKFGTNRFGHFGFKVQEFINVRKKKIVLVETCHAAKELVNVGAGALNSLVEHNQVAHCDDALNRLVSGDSVRSKRRYCCHCIGCSLADQTAPEQI